MTRRRMPAPTPLTRPFWDAARSKELHVPRCGDCGRHFMYPRIRCPLCGSANVSWAKASGKATLHSYVIVHAPAPGFEDDAPYVVAAVELAEGVRMMSRLVDVEPKPERLTLDMPLQVTFVDEGDITIPVFRPAEGSPR